MGKKKNSSKTKSKQNTKTPVTDALIRDKEMHLPDADNLIEAVLKNWKEQWPSFLRRVRTYACNDLNQSCNFECEGCLLGDEDITNEDFEAWLREWGSTQTP